VSGRSDGPNAALVHLANRRRRCAISRQSQRPDRESRAA
jgi:hypothetical protein